MATFSIKDLQERYGVGEHTILGWIRQGELKAYSVARKHGGRPRWRVNLESLVAFESLRTPTQPQPRTQRHKNQSSDIEEFYK